MGIHKDSKLDFLSNRLQGMLQRNQKQNLLVLPINNLKNKSGNYRMYPSMLGILIRIIRKLRSVLLQNIQKGIARCIDSEV